MDPPDSYMEESDSRTSVTTSSSSDYCAISAATSFVANALFPRSPASTVSTASTRADDLQHQQSYQDDLPYSASCKCGGFQTQKLPKNVERSIAPIPEKVVKQSSSKMRLESLGSELVCAICQQLFVEACTIECGHSFCRMCVENWLKTKLSCPICRHPVQKPPISSLCLDKAVLAMLDIAQEKDIAQELLERQMQATKARENECYAQSCLENLFQKAVQQGVRVVHISKQWSPREQQRFLGGIERHQGVAREAYCKVVGLTYEWVGRATREELVIAAANVMLRDMENKQKNWKEGCIAKLRARLEMYIRYG